MRTVWLAIVFVGATTAGLLAVKSTPAPGSTSSERPLTPEALAADAFNSGLKHLNSGDKAGASRKPDQKKALDEYTKALKDFQKAVTLDPKNYRAFNGLGYAYRRFGLGPNQQQK